MNDVIASPMQSSKTPFLHSTVWTEVEDKWLIDIARRESYDDVDFNELTGRTLRSLYNRAYYLHSRRTDASERLALQRLQR